MPGGSGCTPGGLTVPGHLCRYGEGAGLSSSTPGSDQLLQARAGVSQLCSLKRHSTAVGFWGNGPNLLLLQLPKL